MRKFKFGIIPNRIRLLVCFHIFFQCIIMWSHRNPTWLNGYNACDWQLWCVWRGGVSFYGKCSVVIRNFHQSHHLMDLNLQKQDADTHMEAFGRLALKRFTVASSIMDATLQFSLAQPSKFIDSSCRHHLHVLLFESALFSTVFTRATNAFSFFICILLYQCFPTAIFNVYIPFLLLPGMSGLLFCFLHTLIHANVSISTSQCRRIEQFFLNSCSTRFILARGSSLTDGQVFKRIFSLYVAFICARRTKWKVNAVSDRWRCPTVCTTLWTVWIGCKVVRKCDQVAIMRSWWFIVAFKCQRAALLGSTKKRSHLQSNLRSIIDKYRWIVSRWVNRFVADTNRKHSNYNQLNATSKSLVRTYTTSSKSIT